MSILLSFLSLLLYIAVVVFIAFVIRYLIVSVMGWSLDPDIEKWGRIIVALICVIAIVVWLAGLLGAGPGLPYFWRLG